MTTYDTINRNLYVPKKASITRTIVGAALMNLSMIAIVAASLFGTDDIKTLSAPTLLIILSNGAYWFGIGADKRLVYSSTTRDILLRGSSAVHWLFIAVTLTNAGYAIYDFYTGDVSYADLIILGTCLVSFICYSWFFMKGVRIGVDITDLCFKMTDAHAKNDLSPKLQTIVNDNNRFHSVKISFDERDKSFYPEFVLI